MARATQRVLLADVARLGVASADQLQAGSTTTPPSPVGVLPGSIWPVSVRPQILARLERTVGGVRAGSKATATPSAWPDSASSGPSAASYREPWAPNLAYLRHALGVSELYVELRTQMANRLLTYDTEPACWRSYPGPAAPRPP